MNRRRPAHRPQRQQIWIGCEGASEAGYAALLQDLVNAKNQPFYLKIEELTPGAGDPLARVEMAVMRIDQLTKKRTAPNASFILLDTDQLVRDPLRGDRARRMAADHDITLIWQGPCFEAVLLRHLPGRADRQPPDSRLASDALLREWPEYRKPMPRAQLAQRIDLAAVLRAATVEADLAGLLCTLGLIDDQA